MRTWQEMQEVVRRDGWGGLTPAETRALKKLQASAPPATQDNGQATELPPSERREYLRNLCLSALEHIIVHGRNESARVAAIKLVPGLIGIHSSPSHRNRKIRVRFTTGGATNLPSETPSPPAEAPQ